MRSFFQFKITKQFLDKGFKNETFVSLTSTVTMVKLPISLHYINCGQEFWTDASVQATILNGNWKCDKKECCRNCCTKEGCRRKDSGW
jgi:hypothetical protein